MLTKGNLLLFKIYIMKHKPFNQVFIGLFTLITLSFTALGFTNSLGLDSYEVYLNNKLILKQSVNQPLNLRVLQLGKTNVNDQLRINYTHCNSKGAGTDRSILIKDEKGNTLKKWQFTNAKGADLSMLIPLRDLMQIEKANAGAELSIYYTAQELPKGEMLAFVRFK